MSFLSLMTPLCQMTKHATVAQIREISLFFIVSSNQCINPSNSHPQKTYHFQVLM